MAQTPYLTEEEYDIYCDQMPVTSSQVMYASALIDAYVGLNDGKSKFTETEQTEVIKLNRKGIGHLKVTPIINISKVCAVGGGYGYSGIRSELDLGAINYDTNGYIYVCMNPSYVTRSSLFLNNITALEVTYTSGYKEIPEQVKRACGMVAMNISQTATFTDLQSMTTLDARFALNSSNILTSEIKTLLSRYRV